MDITVQPKFCQYCSGQCEEDFSVVEATKGIFLYSNEPPTIASTIEAAIKYLNGQYGAVHWKSWKDFGVSGQIIFCAICKQVRFSGLVLCDVTTLNMNLLFEIGFALALGKRVIPIRDTTFIRDKSDFEKLGTLDVLGFEDFTNSEALAKAVMKKASDLYSEVVVGDKIDRERPLYVHKGPIQTDGEIRILAILRKSYLNFRAFDISETPRISLFDLRKQIGSSLAFIGHLYSEHRVDAKIHNARCALMAGYAVASGRYVKLFQEGDEKQPIDFRDIVVSYSSAEQIPKLLEPFVRTITKAYFMPDKDEVVLERKFLETVDFGDGAAENEAGQLKSYFVQTAQFSNALKGYASLVVGRKGTGKTAIFFAVRDISKKVGNRLVLDLKPEGHQFVRLKDLVSVDLNEGTKAYTLTGFWNSLLLSEIAHKVLTEEIEWAKRDPKRHERFLKIQDLLSSYSPNEDADFSERLLEQVDRLSKLMDKHRGEDVSLTQVLYSDHIKDLSNLLSDYLSEKDEVVLLFDNIDKGWPTHGADKIDLLIIRCLLDASRKIKAQLERRHVDFKCLVFLRNDIYSLLLDETPDRGKESEINLEWKDEETFKELVRKRLIALNGLSGDFETVWNKVFEPIVGTARSFNYILERTLMRPRDLILFLKKAIEVAVNRGHERVNESDIVQAEKDYSEDMLYSVVYELSDNYPGAGDLLFKFYGSNSLLGVDEVKTGLESVSSGLKKTVGELIEILLWFGFLGISENGSGTETYSYHVNYNVKKLNSLVDQGQAKYVIHPAFRSSLNVK